MDYCCRTSHDLPRYAPMSHRLVPRRLPVPRRRPVPRHRRAKSPLPNRCMSPCMSRCKKSRRRLRPSPAVARIRMHCLHRLRPAHRYPRRRCITPPKARWSRSRSCCKPVRRTLLRPAPRPCSGFRLQRMPPKRPPSSGTKRRRRVARGGATASFPRRTRWKHSSYPTTDSPVRPTRSHSPGSPADPASGPSLRESGAYAV